jgi:hypothetical protein
VAAQLFDERKVSVGPAVFGRFPVYYERRFVGDVTNLDDAHHYRGVALRLAAGGVFFESCGYGDSIEVAARLVALAFLKAQSDNIEH